MKINRKRLSLNSLIYSREWDVDRSTGVHLMSIVEWIGHTAKIEKKYHDDGEVNLDNFFTPGFLWEHVMAREEQLEHAMSVEAVRMEINNKAELIFPGEMYWCRQCDEVMSGGKKAQKHARVNGHTGIYSTPDAYDTVEDKYVEWKFTWKSSRRTHPSVLNSKDGVWRYVVQCAWNCFTLGTNKAKLIVLHCHGDYRKGLPEPIAYEINLTFTDKDIRRNKMMIVTNSINQGWI